MTDLRQQSTFLDNRALTAAGRRCGRDELQRDLTIEAGVPGAEDFAERAVANSLDQPERSPVDRIVRDGGWRRQRPAMQLTDRRDKAEMAEEGPRGVIRTRFRGAPVDLGIVEHGACDLIEEFLTRHTASGTKRA